MARQADSLTGAKRSGGGVPLKLFTQIFHSGYLKASFSLKRQEAESEGNFAPILCPLMKHTCKKDPILSHIHWVCIV